MLGFCWAARDLVQAEFEIIAKTRYACQFPLMFKCLIGITISDELQLRCFFQPTFHAELVCIEPFDLLGFPGIKPASRPSFTFSAS